MTTGLPFTEMIVRRIIGAVRKAGLRVTATRVAPDGTVTIFHDDAAAEPPSVEKENSESRWTDVQA
jgi:hypothetical protein